ncbi:MAG: protein translocase subunit SecD [Parvularculaceae bacterium]
MLQFSKWQAGAILGAVALAALFVLPNLFNPAQLEKFPSFLPTGQINLGLDLRGGSYLLLRVETDELIENRLIATRSEVQRAMRPSGSKERITLVARPSVDAENDRIVVRLRDGDQADDAIRRAREVTRAGIGLGGGGAAARPYAVAADGDRVTLTLTPEARREYVRQAVGDSIEVIRRRVDPAGNKEVSIQPQGDDRIVVQAPGDNDPEQLKALINRTGQLSFHRVDQSVDPAAADAGLLPPGRVVYPFAESEGPGALGLYEEPEVTGDMVEQASAGLNPDGGGFQINFAFDSRGARRFANYTRENVGELFAIVLDETIISAPRIQTPITGGSGRITGNFAPDEAARIATLIRSGALPATLTTIEQRSVGAGRGADSVRAGALALVIGFVGVIIYMVVSYGRFGVYADMALLANIVLIAGFLSLFGSTLTLPGIAGIDLTIGMAVDANVLIFERIREEVTAGKPPVRAIELGYQNARSAILDANVTTFFAAFIMFFLGAGPVRGFAITLMIGVVTSVFTAYLLSRVLAGGWVLSKRPKTIAL